MSKRNQNILNSIRNIERKWTITSDRVRCTKGWKKPELTITHISAGDIVHLLRTLYGSYYGDKLDTMLEDYVPEIYDLRNKINYELLPNELAKLDEYVETQINKLVAEKKNKQSQNSFAKSIFLERDIEAWIDFKDNIKITSRNSLFEPLKNYKYGNRTVQ